MSRISGRNKIKRRLCCGCVLVFLIENNGSKLSSAYHLRDPLKHKQLKQTTTKAQKLFLSVRVYVFPAITILNSRISIIFLLSSQFFRRNFCHSSFSIFFQAYFYHFVIFVWKKFLADFSRTGEYRIWTCTLFCFVLA